MTLLITLGSESQVHQSSDYRLSDKGVQVETENGAKQQALSTQKWAAQVSFTGIARDGYGYESRAWLLDEATNLSADATPETFVRNVVQRGTRELLRVVKGERRLTIIVAVATIDGCRLFLVSNFESPDGKPFDVPRAALDSFEIDLSSPKLLVNGLAKAFPRPARRRLQLLFRKNADPKTIRGEMAQANRLAASRPECTQTISQGCWVNSLFQNGTTAGENHGQVAGIPSEIMTGQDITRWARENLRAAPGQEIRVVQTASVRGYALPAGLIAPPDGFNPTEWQWQHAETKLDGGEWAPGIGVTCAWGPSGLPIRPEGITFATPEEARDENRSIAMSVANRFGTVLPQAVNNLRQQDQSWTGAATGVVPVTGVVFEFSGSTGPVDKPGGQ